MARTPLTYYGGKAQKAARIAATFPSHRVYVEPYAGGAAVLFAKPPAQRETLNDLDGRVVNFWRVLRDDSDALASAVAATPYARAEWQAAAEEDAGDAVERARRFVVRNSQSFAHTQASWSTPTLGPGRNQWQPGTWANLPPRLLAAARRLQGVALECSDALDVIQRWDVSGCVMFIDPPYIAEARKAPHKQYRHDDNPGAWEALCAVLSTVRYAHVALTAYPCVSIDALRWPSVSLGRRCAMSGELTPDTLWTRPSS